MENFLKEHGLIKFPLTGDFSHQQNLWAIGWETASGAVRIKAGDWRTGAKWLYEGSSTGTITDEDRVAWKEQEEAAERKQEALHAKAETEAASIWIAASPTGTHAYLTSKKLSSLYGARLIFRESEPHLVIPIYNSDKLCGLQFISPTGYKSFLEGTRMKGSYMMIGEVKDTLFIAEGFATAASIHEATGEAVVVAINAGNLKRVVPYIHAKYSEKNLVICADDDYLTKHPVVNPGLPYARKAAMIIGARVVIPKWFKIQSGTDFNDLHCSEGLQAVRDCIRLQLDSGMPALIPEMPCMVKLSPKGATILPQDSEVSEEIYKHVGTKWRANEKDVFIWQGTHWKEHTYDELSRELTPLVSRALGGQYSNTKEGAIKDHLVRSRLRKMGDDVFQTNVTASAFQNGTLRIHQEGIEHKLTFEAGHDPEDKLMTCLPFNLSMDQENPKALISYITEHLLVGTEQIDEQLDLMQEIFGACLLPYFPVITFFTGKPRTGKSTLVKLISSLVSQENISGVDPTNMFGFGLENMLGKSVNVLTDLNTSANVNVSVLKQIEDRVPIQVQRKYRTNVMAYIPAVHLFAGNSLPRLGEDYSGAIERRVRIFTCNNKIKGKAIVDLHQKLLQDEQDQIISWAYRGLERVVSQGGYSYPECMSKVASAWSMREDRAAMFIDALDSNETCLVRNPEGQITRGALNQAYTKWSEDMGLKVSMADRGRLYEHFEGKVIHGTRFVVGLSERSEY